MARPNRPRKAWRFLIDRLSERGSMAHIVNVGAAISGTIFLPENKESVIEVCLIVAAVVGVLTKEAQR